jgi:3-dehydroquinate dehydratase/shikimate dehydrogenase
MSLDVDRACVAIARTRHKMVALEIQEAAKRGAKFIELRLDFLARAPDLKRLLHNKPCPIICTIRRLADGGRWKGTEEARHMMLRQCIVGGFDWVDLETDVADTIRRFGSVKRIVSYHNTEGVPDDLETIYEKMSQQDADVLKIAVAGQKPEDNLRVLNLIRNAKKPTVAHCMGDFGFPSRILSLKYGSPFMYCAFNTERSIAPGLPSFDDVKNLYHIDAINADTQVFGVIGDPVGHSLSPLLHNKLFRKLGVNAIYLPFRVPRGKLETFLNAFDALPVKGYSVTIPHKEAAVTLAKHKDELVGKSYAANTLIRGDDGFHAFNTDYTAVVETINAYLPPKEDGTAVTVEGRMVLVLGAGGIARAVCHALKQAGAALTITNRTSERATKLAAEVEARTIEWGGRHVVQAEIIINCTSVGMHPNVDESPFHGSALQPGLIVFDSVYNPESTLLVKEARARGCRVITGVELFVRQAWHQFRHFTGREPSLESMRQIVRRAMSPLTHVGDDE